MSAIIRLQWGRSDDGAEDELVGDSEIRDSEPLQWGRSDDGAEDLGIQARRRRRTLASMGPLR